MQLEQYISDLLYRYECVTVPNFGAFLSQRVSATIHNYTNAFYPPKKSLTFNEGIQTSDGLLINYVADVEKIPFETASKKIENRVKALKASLHVGETLHFKNIGDLKLNSENKIEFTPSYHLNYLTDAFGLTQFTSPAITREAYKETVKEIEKQTPITITPEKRKAKKPYLKYAAIALLALTVSGLTFSKYYLDDVAAHNQVAQEKANKKLDSKIQEATFIISNPLPAVTLNLTKQKGNYHIVAGAFTIEANCNKKIKELKTKGFNARKIGVNKHGLHLVAYNSYVNRIDAFNALSTIRKTNNPEAWVLVKALK